MAKFRLLKPIGYNQKGTILGQSSWGDHPKFSTPSMCGFQSSFSFYKEEIGLLIDQGYIEEVPEPRWTDQDMIDFRNMSSQTVINLSVPTGSTCPLQRLETSWETLKRFEEKRVNK